MIDINDINREIASLENNNMANFQTCEKLSVLYIIRDHIDNHDDKTRYSFAPAPVDDNQSEFLKAVYSTNIERALKIIDTHMNGIKLVYPKEYKLVLDKLNEII